MKDTRTSDMISLGSRNTEGGTYEPPHKALPVSDKPLFVHEMREGSRDSHLKGKERTFSINAEKEE